VGDVNPVAEPGDVPDHPLGVDVLVVEEDDCDDLHASAVRGGHPLIGIANNRRAEMPVSRSSPCLRARTKIATLRWCLLSGKPASVRKVRLTYPFASLGRSASFDRWPNGTAVA